MDNPEQLTSLEQATMWLTHELGYVTQLAAGVSELDQVESAMRSALHSLNSEERFTVPWELQEEA